ncbi:MAG TPA: cytidine deaminase [Ktedonobacterales bacterium]
MNRQTLIEAARAAALRAYAPYSHFRVGAAIVIATSEGPRVVTGANVENASYGLTLCAERTALAAATQLVPAGELLAVEQVAVACIDAKDDATDGERMPCGACRQWLAELAPQATYYVDGVERDLTLDDLLPNAFRLER